MMRVRPSLAVASLLLLACEGRSANVVGPVGRGELSRFVAIGTGISMGTQSAGVLYNSQVQAWPALLARAALADFSVPQLHAPGCSPPLVAPLQFWRLLSGVDAAAGDSSCSGLLAGFAPPTNDLALDGATAWAALNLTPKVVTATPPRFAAGDRARYPLVLATTQSQVTAMLVRKPSFVSVELGLTEVLGAATTGLLVAAGSYTQAAPYTYVPPSLFAPVYAQIADSVKASGAKAVLLGVPQVTNLATLRPGGELWADRDALLSFGIVVAADCQQSANFVATATLVPSLAARARAAAAPQPLSCTDTAGVQDFVLTPADVALLAQAVGQMNAQVKQLADQNKWAFVDVDAVFAATIAGRPAYSAAVQLACTSPFGQYVSLDGVTLAVAGHQLLANAVAAAVDARYGFTIPATPVAVTPWSLLCP